MIHRKITCKLLFAIILLISIPDAYGQQREIDSLLLQVSNPVTDKKSSATMYLKIGRLYSDIDKYPEALDYIDSGIGLAQKLGNKKMLGDGYNYKSIVYIQLENYPVALDFSLKALNMYEAIDLQIGIGQSYSKIADIYGSMEEYDNMLNYLNRALEIRKRLPDTSVFPGIYSDIGVAYMGLKNYPKSLLFHSIFMNHPNAKDDEYGQSLNAINMGNVYHHMQDYTQAVACYKRALQGFEKLNNTPGICMAYINLGSAEVTIKQTESGISNSNIALRLALDLNNKSYIANAADNLATGYKQKGDYVNALKYTEMHQQYVDSLNKEDVSKQLQQLNFNYELDKKADKISQLEKDNIIKEQRSLVKNFIVVGLIIILVVLIAFFIFLTKKNRLILGQKKEIELQATDLKELNLFKDKILSILSHDLRSPIGSARNIIALMDDSVEMSADEKLFLRMQMGKQLDGMGMLVDNLLQWASSSQNTASYSAAELAVRNIAETSINLLENSATEKKVTIHNNIPENIRAYGVYNQVYTVIRNLLSNAIKFTPANGSITLSAEVANGMVDISIQDTGLGMTAEQVATLFTKNKSSTYGTEGEKGIGLGLTVCKEFVEANGGTIMVTSKVNEGSVFLIRLPECSTMQ